MRSKYQAASALSWLRMILARAGLLALPIMAAGVHAIVCPAGMGAEVAVNWITGHRVTGVASNELSSAAIDPQGNIWATGIARSSLSESKLLVVKFNAGGMLVWSQAFDAGAGGMNFGSDIAVHPGGDGYVVGTMTTGEDNLDIVALRLDADGNVMGTLVHDSGSAQRDEGVGIALSSDGTPYLTGVIDRSGVNGMILKQWAPGGWQHVSNNSNPKAPYVDALGQVYVVDEWEFGNVNFAIRLAKFSSSGAQLWERLFDFEDVDRAVALAVDSFGEVYGVANTVLDGEEPAFNIGVVKYGPASQFRWYQIVSPGGSGLPKEVRAAAVDAAGNVYVAGSVEQELLVMKVSTFGFMEWERRDVVGVANDIMITPTGMIVAVGESATAAVIVGYDASGMRLFDAAYTGSAGEAGSLAMALTADGKPIAVGRRRASANQVDGMALRYQVCEDACETTPGDANCDGVVSIADVGPFVLALTQPAQYVAAFPECQLFNSDINGGDSITLSDIAHFVALLTGG